MKRIIDLSEIRQKHIESIEKKAAEEYNAVKLEDDVYIIPANIVKTDNICEDFKDSSMYKDESVRKAIEAMKVSDGDYISVTCKSRLATGEKVLEVVNINSEHQEIIELTVNSKLGYDERERLLNMIAYVHKDKDVYITFYVNYNLTLLEQLYMN